MTLSLTLIGIGTGNPEHLTLQAIRAINAQDLILIPNKGKGKDDLAQLRRDICAEVLTSETTRIVEFDLPVRDETTLDYRKRVDDWHDAIAAVWQATILAHGGADRVGLLVWGDPALYDSTLRIAGRLDPAPELTVIPGITSVQTLTAAHATVLNDIGAPFVVTTGRRLRDEGWPEGAAKVVVMLDAGGAFEAIDPIGVHIWWGAYVGMKEQIIIEGPLLDVRESIVETRARARADHGWIMDIYMLKRG
ncbi:precorrin-6A synthase (deacetylating) [Sulfitobacter sp. S190]|uniref:precorrin-6A synthase (deacetylating) n=1 Tax=Sulfitobacter sp. S190 TaxID=2867022 RepID=UPI0021A3E647|nr:precorrin-6A synthase (deacetylating) [Sulfitobacter sp. S190]UWR22325.1 precorrin-6A synthase (deacetylating) [Sulfitobacter sp. S190]